MHRSNERLCAAGRFFLGYRLAASSGGRHCQVEVDLKMSPGN
jgi:hypothetical protein